MVLGVGERAGELWCILLKRRRSAKRKEGNERAECWWAQGESENEDVNVRMCMCVCVHMYVSLWQYEYSGNAGKFNHLALCCLALQAD